MIAQFDREAGEIKFEYASKVDEKSGKPIIEDEEVLSGEISYNVYSHKLLDDDDLRYYRNQEDWRQGK